MKFAHGKIVATPNALANVPNEEMLKCLSRHLNGDWGDIDEDDKKANDEALRSGSRLLSAYHTKAGVKFWILTEWDRSCTTILLPEDY